VWGDGKFACHVAALEAALRALGSPISYDELMMTSGGAFRTAWCPGLYNYGSAQVAPEDLVRNGAQAAGAQAERHPCDSQDEAWKLACASLDQGRPVIAWDGWGALVMAGYDRDGRKILVQRYDSKAEGYETVPFSAPGMPDPVYGPSELVLLRYDQNAAKPPLDWPALLARAVRFADWEPDRRVCKVYVFGLGAYDAWAKTLRTGVDPNGLQVDAQFTRFMAWTLIDARSRAATVLKANATVHGEFANAAGRYRTEVDLLRAIPAALNKGDFADAAVREELAKLVEQARAEEVQAIDAVRRALKDLGPPKPEPADQVAGQADQHYQRGVELKRAGQASQAADELRAAITADPKHVKAHYALGWVLLDLKDRDGAKAEFRKVIEIAPDSDEAKEAKKALERIGP
jgi:tetratricopeptide (TPR) repeat protein